MRCPCGKKLIWLSGIWRNYPSELRADLQRYYGICLDAVGISVSVLHVAALVRCLPLGSCVLERLDPRARYTETDWLLLGILNSIRTKPINPFENQEKQKPVALSAERMGDLLSKPRKEVKDVD